MIPVANKVMGVIDRRSVLGREYRSGAQGRKKERRKTPYDRRKSVRDGVIVALSLNKDRRKNPDRRSRKPGSPLLTDNSKGSGYDIIA